MKDFNNSPKYNPLNNVTANPLTLAEKLREKADIVRERNRVRERNAFYKKLNSYIRLLKSDAKKTANMGHDETTLSVETGFASEVVNYFISQGFKSETSNAGTSGMVIVHVSWS